MSQLGNAVTYQQYEQSVPITEVAKNTRLSLSSLQSSQCHLQNTVAELKEVVSNLETLVIANQLYNINEQFIVSGINSLSFPSNSLHAISYLVLAGTADITEAGNKLEDAPTGYSGEATATTLLTGAFLFEGLTTDSKIVIRTIK